MTPLVEQDIARLLRKKLDPSSSTATHPPIERVLAMNARYKSNTRRNHAILCVLITLIASAVFYKAFSVYILSRAKKNIQNLLLSHKGIHLYFQRVMLPALAKYQKEGKLSDSFYAPEIFSSSYIVRNQHQFYNQEPSAAGFPEVYYKLAAINPRNPVNRADAREEELIERFNRDRSPRLSLPS